MNREVFKNPTVIKLGVAGLLLVSAAVWLLLNLNLLSGRPTSNVIAFYQYTRPERRNARWRFARNKPMNASSRHTLLIYEFAGAQGRIQLIKHPMDAKISLMIGHLPPRGNGNWRRRQPPWLAGIQGISDPVQQALTLAAFRGPRAVHYWLVSAGAKAPAINEAKLAATSFNSARALLVTQEREGLAHPHLLAKIEKNLATFLKMPGDPVLSAPKQQMARKIYREGTEFYQSLQARRQRYVRHYVQAIEAQLSDKVKKRITDRVNRILKRFKRG